MGRLLFTVATVWLALLASFQGTWASEKFETEKDVLVLTSENFDEAINCGHCKNLEPEYAKAAEELKKRDPPLYIAKIDTTIHQEMGTRFEIRGFPTLKLFKNGVPLEYKGGRTAKDIVEYVVKKSGPAILTLKSVEEAEAYVSGSKKAGIGFFDSLESESAKKFAEYAEHNDAYSLAYTEDKAIISKYAAKSGTLQFITPEGSFTTALDWKKDTAEEDLSTWMFGHAIPLLWPFVAAETAEVFSGPIRVHLLAFLDEESPDYEKQKKEIHAIVAKSRTKALSILIPKKEAQILQAFDFTPEDVPKVVIADMREGAMKRFFFEGDVSKKTKDIEKFINDFLKGNLKPKLRSEEPAADDFAKPVKVLKGKTFKKEVLDSKNDWLVEFYAPWCGHCKSLEPIYARVAEKLEGVKHLSIGKMDATLNEMDIKEIEVLGFPTIYFFPANKKLPPIKYEEKREVNVFLEFLKKHTTKSFDYEADPEGMKYEVPVDPVAEEALFEPDGDEKAGEEEVKDEL